jgi:small multidrug resistance family-3 protein
MPGNWIADLRKVGFIALSLLWGWGIDGDRPDRADVLGAVIALVGVCVIFYWPRR